MFLPLPNPSDPPFGVPNFTTVIAQVTLVSGIGDRDPRRSVEKAVPGYSPGY